MNKRFVNNLAAKIGIELHRYIPRDSPSARIRRMLDYYAINLVLDVGANSGDYALNLRALGYKERIVSFEPLAAAHALLSEQCGKDALWTPAERAAIGDYNGEIKIQVSKNSYSSSILEVEPDMLKVAPDIAYVSHEIVPIRRLDHLVRPDLIAKDNVFLKIDVQGFERQVLDGASKIMTRVTGIQAELSLVSIYTNQPLYQEMIKHIDNLGYELHAVLPGFTDSKSGRMLQMDGIFFRK